MEQLDRAKAREAQRLSKNILDPVVVRNVQDIKRVVAELDPKKNPQQENIEIATNLEFEGKTYEVRANTKSRSKRDMLVDGLSIIQNRIDAQKEFEDIGQPVEINGVAMRNIPVGSGGASGRSWVDPLISQWTGGYRDGINICWDLDGFKYKYDIFEHKLTRVENGSRSTTTSSVS